MGEASRRFQADREGRQRLVAWLEQAKEDAKNVSVAEFGSPLGRTQSSYLSYDKLDRVMIYPAPKGGWHVDVVLKDLPPGIPNSMGTPVETPCKTQEEAEEVGRSILAGVVAQIEKNGKQTPLPPVFLLCGWKVPLFEQLFAIAAKEKPEAMDGYGSPLQAEAEVEKVLALVCPDGFNGDKFNDWPMGHKVKLMAVLHQAVLSGLFRYPPRKDGAPVG